MDKLIAKWKNLDAYPKTIVTVVTVLSVLVAVFVMLNLTTRLSVYGVGVVGTQQAAELENQRLVVRFNRPVRLANPAEVLSIEPQTDFLAVSQGEELYIFFNSTLNSDQEYKLSINSTNLVDVYGSKLEQDYVFTWRTRALNLAYLEKNYPAKPDRIMTTTAPFTESRELYATNDIVRYRLRGEWLAVVKRVNPDRNELVLINLISKEERVITTAEQNVYWVEFADSEDLYVVLQDLTKIDEYDQPVGGRQIYNYQIAAQRLELLPLGLELMDVDELVLSLDGQALIIKDTTNALYYLVDLGNTENTAALGKYVGAGGFNSSAEKLIFTELDIAAELKNYPFIVLLDSERQRTEVTDGLSFAIDPIYFKRQDFIAYSQFWASLENSRGLFEIIIKDEQLETYAAIRQADKSLELPKVSMDDKFLAVEAYDERQLTNLNSIRVLGFQAKPGSGSLLIYDVLNKRVLDTQISGIEAQWY